jgi:hypothetical protein
MKPPPKGKPPGAEYLLRVPLHTGHFRVPSRPTCSIPCGSWDRKGGDLLVHGIPSPGVQVDTDRVDSHRMGELSSGPSQKRILLWVGEGLFIVAFAFINLVPVETCAKCDGTGAYTHYRPVTQGQSPVKYERIVHPSQCDVCGGRGKVTLFRKWTLSDKAMAHAAPPQEGKGP